MINRLIFLSLVCAYAGLAPGDVLGCQAGENRADQSPNRILGVIPNYRTIGSSKDYKPIRPRDKFKIAAEDSFDRRTLILGGLFGGQAMLTRSTPSFGQGASGYAKYFAGSYADFVVGNYMTEAVYPVSFTRIRAIFGERPAACGQDSEALRHKSSGRVRIRAVSRIARQRPIHSNDV
jgi:hypothetical protein